MDNGSILFSITTSDEQESHGVDETAPLKDSEEGDSMNETVTCAVM